jgi:predicted dienelactone hydrolase
MHRNWSPYTQCLFILVLVIRMAFGQTPAQGSNAFPGISELPAPSGRYAIGRQAFDWIDNARVDLFSSIPGKHRELMVYIWYPAKPSGQIPSGDYFPNAAEIDKDSMARQAARNIFGVSWSRIAVGLLRSHAITNAPPEISPRKFPVVLFSHGSSATTFSYTAQIEDFVSHGYIVVAVEHTDAVGLVRFPDGRIRLFHDPPASPSPPKNPLQAMIDSAEEGTQTGAEDLRFVLDILAEKKIPIVASMDLKRVAAVGHSYGGTLTARACQIEPRIKACISEDGEVNPVGAFFDYPDHTSIEQPFLLIEITNHYTDAELSHMGESRTQWNNFLAHEREQLDTCIPGSYHVLLSRSGMVHASFSDGPLLNTIANSIQASVALNNLLLTEKLERSFLDKYLKGATAPLFDQAAKTPLGVRMKRIGH